MDSLGIGKDEDALVHVLAIMLPRDNLPVIALEDTTSLFVWFFLAFFM